MISIDDAYLKAQALWKEISADLTPIETEEDARFRIINRLLTEVLGWDFADVRTEPHTDAGYTDYLLHTKGERTFVIEAKRTGKLLVDTLSDDMKAYVVGGPALRSAADGIFQAARYCLQHGVNFAALSTGLVWIAFLPFPGNGQSYSEGRAIVFPNFESILSKFAIFFDLFSKGGVAKKTYKSQMLKASGLTVQEFEPLACVNRNEERQMLPKSQMALDLEPVFREFFGAISGETDKDLLLECFVESRESALADASFEKIVRDVSANIEALATSRADELAQEIEFAVESGHGESVVLVGNKGSGKSTFLERFFDLVLAEPLREKCLVIRLNLLRSTGEAGTLSQFLIKELRAALESKLFKLGFPTYEELQGLYFSDYQRWSMGQHKALYQSDKNAFKIKFGDYLGSQVEADTYSYILKLLESAVKSRQLLPCIIFDNSDHFSEAIQQEVFQFSQALHTAVKFTFVVVPITDRSVWRLSKSGPLQTYQAKYFYLPVPSTKEVLDKRLAFLKRKADSSRDPRQYFVGKGIKLTVDNIRAFAACVEEVLIKEDYVARRIGWLANNEIRRSLTLCQLVIVSPHLSIDDLLATYAASKTSLVAVSHPKFMRALILGDYDGFSREDNSFVTNVFAASGEFVTTPLLKLSLVKLLVDKAGSESGAGSYLGIPAIRSYFDAMGVESDPVDEAIRSLLEFRIVEPYDASDDEIHLDQRVAVTHSGRMHFEMATTDISYLVEMALATPIRIGSVVDEIRVFSKSRAAAGAHAAIAATFLKYCLTEDLVFSRIPSDAIYNGQRQIRDELQKRWIEAAEGDLPLLAKAGLGLIEPNAPPNGLSHVAAKVIWYDSAKAYGFVDCGLTSDALIGKRVLEAAQINFIAQGDVIICDVAPGAAGKYQVIQVYSVEKQIPEGTAAQYVEGEILFFNSTKHFAFASAVGLGDVYVPARALSDADIDVLYAGTKVQMVVEPGRRFGRLTCAIIQVVEETTEASTIV